MGFVTDQRLDPLLPANATALERELTRQGARLSLLDPSAISALWDAAQCPAELLPHLAWALSVDAWDDEWPEATKRLAIAMSPEQHRLKGTLKAVANAASLFGCRVAIAEWHMTDPPGRRGTAHLTAYLVERSSPDAPLLTAPLFAKVRDAVLAAKPKSRAISFRMGVGVIGGVGVAAAFQALTMTRACVRIGPPRKALAPLAAGVAAQVVTITRRAARLGVAP